VTDLSPVMPPVTLDERALGRATLARQMLLERAAVSVPDAVERLVALQAQAPLAPYVGLWSRVEAFAPDDLAERIVDRSLVRLSLLRGTVHLATADDCCWLRPVLQPVHDRFFQSGAYAKAIVGMDLAELASVARALVDERPRTNPELRDALAARWPGRDAAALATVIRMLLALVQVPPRGLWGQGGQATHTSAQAWLARPFDEPTPDDPAAGVDRLVLRYLAGFGPATVRDAQVWSGLTRLGEVFERLRRQLVTFEDGEGRELFDLPDAPRPNPDDTPVPVRFLPAYDNLLRSHDDRSRVLDQPARDRLASKNDAPKPTFLVDGVVAGGWKLDRKRRQTTLTVDPFVPLTDDQLAAVTAEASDLLTWSAPATADANVVQISPV